MCSASARQFSSMAANTLNAYAEVQPLLYRSGVGAPDYQVFTDISLQLPSHSRAAGIYCERAATRDSRRLNL